MNEPTTQEVTEDPNEVLGKIRVTLQYEKTVTRWELKEYQGLDSEGYPESLFPPKTIEDMAKMDEHDYNNDDLSLDDLGLELVKDQKIKCEIVKE